MMFLLLNLLQPRTRLSWVVIAAALLAFAAGVSLLVFFYRRYKRLEKESEEEWDLSRSSLFVNAPPIAAKTEESSAAPSLKVETPITEAAPVPAGGTRELAGHVDLASFAPAPPAEAEPPQSPEEPEAPHTPEPRATEILASPALVETAAETQEKNDEPFDEEVWAGLDIADQPPLTAEQEIDAQSRAPEPLSAARVEQASQRELLEPPRGGRTSHREPYEPPSIEPLAPRDAAATRELRSPQPPGIEQPVPRNAEERMARGTVRLGSGSEEIPGPVEPSRSERETRELWGSLVAATPAIMPDPTTRASGARRSQSFGSILGLPAEPSSQPLILGEPIRPPGETGIGALTHYGQDLGPKGGRAGKIALLIVAVLLCGAAGLYIFVPPVHTRVGAFFARLRGSDAQVLAAAKKPRAQVMPSTRPELNKNMVTARGAVDNISDEPLENLTVEVSLQPGGDALPEIRRIPVTPEVLPPGERGTYEFEYDGKRGTGFAGYTITRLFSKETEVRFRTLAQK